MDAAAEERQRGPSSTPLTARGPGVVPRLNLSPDRPSTSSAHQRSIDLDSSVFWQDGFSIEDSEVAARCQTAAAWHESDESLQPEILAARDQEVRSGMVVSQLTKRGFDDQFRELGLKDYFDEFGQRRFENLSMTVAASTFPEVRGSFGSQADYSLRAQDKQKFSARAYRMSTAVVERDRLSHRTAAASRYKSLSEEDRNNQAHVKQRQLNVMFAIGNPQDKQDIDLFRFLPACCGQRPFDNVPLECGTRRQERDHRKQNEKLNMLFSDSNPHNVALVKRQDWVLNFSDIQMVLGKVSAWMSSAGLLPNSGVDRSTFCQMLVELDMIDQEKLPYIWALQVFDLKAKPMKMCTSDPDYVDQTQEFRVTTVYFISKWDFISVLDILVRQRFPESSRETFLNRFRHVSDFLEKGWKKSELDAKEAARAAQLRLDAERDRKSKAMAAMQREISGRESAMSNGRGSATPQAYPVSVFPIPESQTWKHDRNISGMLKEPEVIAILQQFRSLFLAVFNSYASEAPREGRKNMTCEDVLTFCYDFALVPRLASRHEVVRLYNLAICIEEEVALVPPSQSIGEEPPQRSDSVRSTGSRNSDTNSRGRERSSIFSPGGQRKPSKGFRRASFQLLVEKVSQGKGLSLPTVEKVIQPKSPIGRGSRFKAVAQAALSATPDQEEEEPEAPAPGPVILKIFGVSALAETLLRLAFGYFLVFGNSVQSAMTSRAKIFWFFAFMRANLVQLREGIGQPRQTAVGAFEGSRKGGRAKVLECLRPEAFDELEAFPLQAEDPIEDEPLESAASGRSDDGSHFMKEAWASGKSKTLPTLAAPPAPAPPLLRIPGQGPGISKLTPPPFKKDSFALSSILCGKLLKSSVDIQSLMAENTLDKKALRKRLKKAATRHPTTG